MINRFCALLSAVLILPAFSLILAGCNLDQDLKEVFVSKKKSAPAEGKAAKPAAKKKSDTAAEKKPAAEKDAAGNPAVKFVTNRGEITIELDAKNAPISTQNFLNYVESGFYDGTIFHRVIKDFMVQGGGFTAEMKEKDKGTPPIKNEADNGVRNLRGTLAMARTQVVDSATSQFFINLKDNAFLDHGSRDFGYAVFGKVTDGMAVVDEIAKSPTGNKGYHDDVPVTPVIVEKAIRLR